MFLTTPLLTPLAFLFSIPSTAINEYIFDFNLTHSLIIFPLNSSFILPSTFVLTGSKTLNAIPLDPVDNHQNQTNLYLHKNFHKHLLF